METTGGSFRLGARAALRRFEWSDVAIMRSINESLELGADDALADLDPAFLDAIAGGSGGEECCVNPYITTESLPGGGTRYTPDCHGYRNC